jgi:hypothetical protein
MVRVVDAHTVIVETGQTQRSVTLAGLDGSSPSNGMAIEYLQKFVGSWVLVESHTDGSADLYRSPDALFINSELQRHITGNLPVSLAETHAGTYLGEAAPGKQQSARSAPAKLSRKAASRPGPTSRPRIPGYQAPRRPSKHWRPF